MSGKGLQVAPWFYISRFSDSSHPQSFNFCCLGTEHEVPFFYSVYLFNNSFFSIALFCPHPPSLSVSFPLPSFIYFMQSSCHPTHLSVYLTAHPSFFYSSKCSLNHPHICPSVFPSTHLLAFRTFPRRRSHPEGALPVLPGWEGVIGQNP